MQRSVLLVWWTALTVAGVRVETPPCLSTDDPVRCFLETIGLYLPVISLDQDGIMVNLTNIRCFADLHHLTSDVKPATLLWHGGLDLPSANCTADVTAVNKKDHDLFRGNVSVRLVGFQLDEQLTLTRDVNKVPSHATEQSCAVKGHVDAFKLAWLKRDVPDLVDVVVKACINHFIEHGLCRDIGDKGFAEVNKILQQASSQAANYSHPPPAFKPPQPVAGLVDLRSNEVAAVADYLFNRILGMDGVLSLNTLGKILSLGTGTVELELRNVSVPIGDVMATVDAIRIANVTSWTDISLLETRAQEIDLAFALSEFRVEALVSLVNGPSQVSPYEWLLLAEADHAVFNLGVHLGLWEAGFKELSLEQSVFSDCLLSVARSAMIVNVSFGFDQPVAAISMSHSSEQDLEKFLTDTAQFGLDSLEDVLPNLLSWGAHEAAAAVNHQLAHKVGNATCSAGAKDQLPLDTAALHITWAFSALAAIIGVYAVVMLLRSMTSPTEEDVPLLQQSDLAMHSPSLFMNRKIPVAVRVLVPVTLLILSPAFYLGTTRAAARLQLFVEVPGEPASLVLPELYSFVAQDLIKVLWEEKQNVAISKVFAAISFALSSFWPQVQIALMAAAWLLPPHVFRAKTRDRILRIIEWLGKYCKFDLFVSALLGIGLHVDIPLPLNGPAATLGRVRLSYKCEWPGIAFALACTVITAVTQLVLHYHQISAGSAKPSFPKKVGKGRRIAFGILALLSCAGLAYAVPLPLLNLEYAGFYRYAFDLLELSTQKTVRTSIFLLQFHEYYTVASSFLAYVLLSAFVLVVCVLPALHSLVLAIHWFFGEACPHWLGRSLAVLKYRLHGWAGADVAFVSFSLSMVVMNEVAEAVSEKYCAQFYSEIVKVTGETACVGINTTAAVGWYVLLAASVVHNVLVATFVFDDPAKQMQH